MFRNHLNQKTSHPARVGWIEIRFVRRILWKVPVSHPAWVGWIEILKAGESFQYRVSHLARGGWIEIGTMTLQMMPFMSHPAWGGWIEILVAVCQVRPCKSHPARGGRLGLMHFEKYRMLSCRCPARWRWLTIPCLMKGCTPSSQ